MKTLEVTSSYDKFTQTKTVHCGGWTYTNESGRETIKYSDGHLDDGVILLIDDSVRIKIGRYCAISKSELLTICNARVIESQFDHGDILRINATRMIVPSARLLYKTVYDNTSFGSIEELKDEWKDFYKKSIFGRNDRSSLWNERIGPFLLIMFSVLLVAGFIILVEWANRHC